MQEGIFTYDVVEKIAVLSEKNDTTKELRLVSYRGAKPKYDLRSWKKTEDGEKLLKGLTLTEEEAILLRDALIKREELNQ